MIYVHIKVPRFGENLVQILDSKIVAVQGMEPGVRYVDYVDESVLPDIQALVGKDLSEPYSIFTYRYFLHQWPRLCICAYDNDRMIGTIVCKAEVERGIMRGYIAMLTVDEAYRKKGIAIQLVTNGLDRMEEAGCEEVVLEVEAVNVKALNLYNKLGFMRDEKLCRYYLNGSDAYRMRLLIDKNIKKDEINVNNLKIES